MNLPFSPGRDRLVLYHSLLQSDAGKAMLNFLTSLDDGGEAARLAYLDLVRTLYSLEPEAGPTDDVWQNLVLRHVVEDENAFTIAAAEGSVAPALKQAAAHDLRLLSGLFRLNGRTCRELAGDPDLPTWQGWVARPGFLAPGFVNMTARLAGAADWAGLVDELALHFRANGTGVVGRTWFLGWSFGRLEAVTQPAIVDLDDLAGLVEQKAIVQENTEAFLRGGAGQNLLLYGPRGTGKSSLVRALALRYGSAGLRLVEVGRDRLDGLTDLFRAVRRYPQRFILFLDDLSFESHDADYRAFKSLIEGALEQRPDNLILYVTSNRRHLIPEFWTDRNSPDRAEIHGQDAVEERLSLADRFGRTVLFRQPSEEEYLQIVEHLASRRQVSVPREELREAARKWARWQNGLSGRSARQFVDELEGRATATPGSPGRQG